MKVFELVQCLRQFPSQDAEVYVEAAYSLLPVLSLARHPSQIGPVATLIPGIAAPTTRRIRKNENALSGGARFFTVYFSEGYEFFWAIDRSDAKKQAQVKHGRTKRILDVEEFLGVVRCQK